MENFNFIKALPLKKHREIRIWVIVSTFLLSSVLVAIFFFTFRKVLVIMQYRADFAQLHLQRDKYILEENRLKAFQDAYRLIEKKHKKLIRYTEKSRNPVNFLENFSQLLPDDTKLIRLVINKDKTVDINGYALTPQSFASFMKNIYDSRIFSSVTVVSVHHEKMMQNSDNTMLYFALKTTIM